MFKYFNLILLILIISFSVSCKKVDQITTISGRVIDPYTQKPISGVPIVIWSNYFLGDDYIKVLTGKTNSEGYYSLTTKKEADYISLDNITYYDYYLISKQGDECGYQCGITPIEWGSTTTIDFVDYSPIGRLKINLSVPQTNLVKIEIYDDKIKKYWIDSSSIWSNGSKPNLFYQTSYVRANDTLILKMTKQINGTFMENNIKIYIKAFQLDSIYLEY